MAQVPVCNGTIGVTFSGSNAIFKCSPNATTGEAGTWTFQTREELLNLAITQRVLSPEDFDTLSFAILTILCVAMGLRAILNVIKLGVKSHEKN